MLTIENFHNEIFGPISLELNQGDCLVVQGASGSGKTRFLRAIADLDIAEGEILLAGQSRSDMPAFEWRKQVRFMAAESAWWFDDVASHFSDKSLLQERMMELELVPDLLEKPPQELSTGERQRLGFLRAISDEPAVLLLDEPTSALDSHSTTLLEQMIMREIERGAIVLIVSHDESQASRFSTKRLVFKVGVPELLEVA